MSAAAVPSPPGPVVAVDFGKARIGLAACDGLGIAANGVGVCNARDAEGALRTIAALVDERGATRVLVGWPVNMDGTVGPMAKAAGAFAETLRARLRVPVELVDERLTSAEADARLREAGFSRRDRAKRSDATAAAILLRAWLDRQGRGPEAGPAPPE